MRGKVNSANIPDANTGITPAHAGKSHGADPLLAVGRDHPRTCGEKREYFVGMKSAGGSPPHMRGKVKKIEKNLKKGGITPAHAGKR